MPTSKPDPLVADMAQSGLAALKTFPMWRGCLGLGTTIVDAIALHPDPADDDLDAVLELHWRARWAQACCPILRPTASICASWLREDYATTSPRSLEWPAPALLMEIPADVLVPFTDCDGRCVRAAWLAAHYVDMPRDADGERYCNTALEMIKAKHPLLRETGDVLAAKTNWRRRIVVRLLTAQGMNIHVQYYEPDLDAPVATWLAEVAAQSYMQTHDGAALLSGLRLVAGLLRDGVSIDAAKRPPRRRSAGQRRLRDV